MKTEFNNVILYVAFKWIFLEMKALMKEAKLLCEPGAGNGDFEGKE